MAMKKDEMAYDCNLYRQYIKRAKEYVRQGLFAEGIKSAFQAWEYVDGMMQYARKYEDREFTSVEAIDYVLRYAPLLFGFDSMDNLEEMLKSCKRIEKNTSVCLAERLEEARGLMGRAHALWNYLEFRPNVLQSNLGKQLGGRQEDWRTIAESWEKMGLLERTRQGNSYRLALKTRMGAVIRGKCPGCGSVQEAPKGMLLEPLSCPECRREVFFVILG